MRRYTLSKIKTTAHPQFGSLNTHRLQEIPGIEYLGGEIKVDPNTGMPTEKALLCLVAGSQHSTLRNDPELLLLPIVGHDIKVSSIHTQTKLACKAAAIAMGFSAPETDAIWNNADGFRDIVEAYGRKNNPDFDADDFDLFDS